MSRAPVMACTYYAWCSGNSGRAHGSCSFLFKSFPMNLWPLRQQNHAPWQWPSLPQPQPMRTCVKHTCAPAADAFLVMLLQRGICHACGCNSWHKSDCSRNDAACLCWRMVVHTHLLYLCLIPSKCAFLSTLSVSSQYIHASPVCQLCCWACQAPLNVTASLLPTPPALLQETAAAKTAPPLSSDVVNVTQPAMQLKANVTAVLAGATACKCACCMSCNLLRQYLPLLLPVTAAAVLGLPQET